MDVFLKKGAFILSLDTELAWGSAHHALSKDRMGLYRSTRDVIGRLLTLLERYHIKATWAVVGHLFLDGCRPDGGVKHPDIVRPRYGWFRGDWFSVDPGTDIEADPAWYGRDIIEQIKGCRVSQEIGCHTFSHIIVGDPGCSRECFESELRACQEAAQQLGAELRSFVFPRNSIGHLDVLAPAGFTAFRGPAPSWFRHLPGIASRIGHLVDGFLPVTPPVTLPNRRAGLWDLPASYFYPPSGGLWKLAPVSIRVHKAKLGLAEAAKRRRIFHLWSHPFNLASRPDALLRGLEEIFAEVGRLREAGCLDNLTLGEMAAMMDRSGEPLAAKIEARLPG